jgi:hypothetical protein
MSHGPRRNYRAPPPRNADLENDDCRPIEIFLQAARSRVGKIFGKGAVRERMRREFDRQTSIDSTVNSRTPALPPSLEQRK